MKITINDMKSTSDFEERMELMEIRARLVKIHVARTQQVFSDWQIAKTASDWYKLSQDIDHLLRFITRNLKYFPNRVEHIKQWSTLYYVAKERACMETLI